MTSRVRIKSYQRCHSKNKSNALPVYTCDSNICVLLRRARVWFPPSARYRNKTIVSKIVTTCFSQHTVYSYTPPSTAINVKIQELDGQSPSSLLTVEPFCCPFLGSRHCTCHHLTQPASLSSLNRSTGSMSMYAMFTLPVPRWRVGSTLKEAALLCPSSSY